jgi:hypothetical protein
MPNPDDRCEFCAGELTRVRVTGPRGQSHVETICPVCDVPYRPVLPIPPELLPSDVRIVG